MTTHRMGCGPLWRIDGPPPQPPRFSLLKAARLVDDVDATGTQRWGNGVELYIYPPENADAQDPTLTGTFTEVKPVGDPLDKPQFGGMTIVLGEECSTMGIWARGMSEDEAQARYYQRALTVFSAVEGAAVEKEFMGGAILGNNPHLADGGGTFPAANVAQSVPEAFALLEAEIAASGRAGLIHCTPSMATAAAAAVVLDYPSPGGSADLLTTINGTPVIPGYGYQQAAASPAGHTPAAGTKEWIYASGPVDIRRSEIIQLPEQVFQALDREINLITYYAERYYVVDWDTQVQSAVLCDRTLV